MKTRTASALLLAVTMTGCSFANPHQVLVTGDLAGHGAHERGHHRAHQAQADAPGERARQLVAERPADRAANAEHRRRAAAAARGRG